MEGTAVKQRTLRRRYGHSGRTKARLTPVREIPAYAVIIRAIHERGRAQKEALAELHRRGLYLSEDQKRQAAMSPAELDRHLGVPGASSRRRG